MQPILEIRHLSVSVENKLLLKDISLSIPEGQTHVLFGPNGSGKSSLMLTLMGFPQYRIEEGQILFKGKDITHSSPSERSALGMGIAFQSPPAIKGLKLENLVSEIASRFYPEFVLEDASRELSMESYLHRDVNHGFSGGERKRSEILQLSAQNPDLILLDEPESGVDIENMKTIGEAIRNILHRGAREKRTKSAFIITHTGYILDYLAADWGYVLVDGQIQCENNPYELLRLIEINGFQFCETCELSKNKE
ncbi:ABC transporter ATP-binding protein [Thermospira aquatica]|uniref:ABC transporter ATP-binding protein n=1 Tax=Thermospira aquatica TaxID=2828656 RepID=A0AAX3BFZ8_9SPIR|nr:ABC transporter ATP-binding protein [Thermospira aquatica]URA10959.1 ABC transporter ATP-binding protein [Thermospira aquatica]